MAMQITAAVLSNGLQSTLEELAQKGVVEVTGQISDVERAARRVCCRVGCPGWLEFSSCHAPLLRTNYPGGSAV